MSSQSEAVEEGLLVGTLPYRALGTGQTLLYFPPFAPYHELATGFSRTIELNILRRFAAGGFRVYQLNRRPGLTPGATLSDLAAAYAQAIEQHFEQPVDILGFSTGGTIALNFAAEHPQLLRRLVLASAAHRLSPVAWNASEKAAERAEAHDRRGFQMAMAPAAALSKPAQMAAAAFGWLLAPLTLKRDWDPSDAVITLRADMSIDVDSRLSTTSTPTLIICGDSDPSYPLEITAELGQKLPNARRIVYPRTGHGVVLHKRFVADLVDFLTPDLKKA